MAIIATNTGPGVGLTLAPWELCELSESPFMLSGLPPDLARELGVEHTATATSGGTGVQRLQCQDAAKLVPTCHLVSCCVYHYAAGHELPPQHLLKTAGSIPRGSAAYAKLRRATPTPVPLRIS